MPQSLMDVLLRRQQSTQPDQPLPETLPNEGADPLGKGMDVLLSAAGVRAQKPGDWATGLGSAIGAASMAPRLPFSVVSEGAQKLSPLLERIFASNPGAEAIYGKAMAAQAPEFLANKAAGQTAKYAHNANIHDALLDLDVAGRPRPIPTDTGFATAIPIDQPQRPVGGASEPLMTGNRMRPSAVGITEQMVKQIRGMDPALAKKVYGDLPGNTLSAILSGSIFKDIR